MTVIGEAAAFETTATPVTIKLWDATLQGSEAYAGRSIRTWLAKKRTVLLITLMPQEFATLVNDRHRAIPTLQSRTWTSLIV